MTAAELARVCGGRLRGGCDPKWRLGEVFTDSRKVAPGGLFVALRGARFDGNDFVDDAVARGAEVVVCDSGRAVARSGVAFVEVADTTRALGDIAAAHRRRFDLPVVAITGSNGKTTTKELLRSILERVHTADRVLASEGNFNNHIGLPLTLMRLHGDHRIAIVEMGMNAAGEIARLTEIAAPTHALVTCVAEAHLGGLGSIEAIAAAKGELFAGLGEAAVALVNTDDPLVVREARRFSGRKIPFGCGGVVRAESVEMTGIDRSRFDLVYGDDRVGVDLPLGGRHNVSNAVAAAACAYALGIDAATAAGGLAAAAPPPMRLAVTELGNGVQVVNDAYNANPASLRAAIDTVSAASGGRVLVVLGDMLELGPRARELHRRAGADLAAAAPAFLCAVGEYAGDVCLGAREAGMHEERCVVAADHAEAAAAVAARWSAGDTVLVKGSRGARMEAVVEELTRRGS